MTAGIPQDPRQFGLLATYIAGIAVELAAAPDGQRAHTDGRVVFVTAGRPSAEQRREVVVQCALMAAGSLQPHVIGSLRARPRLARRYLSIEGQRALTELSARLPLAATLCAQHENISDSPAESLAIAKSSRAIDDPPHWFGAINPPRFLARSTGAHTPITDEDLRLRISPIEAAEDPDADDSDDDTDEFADSKILKLFQAPAFTFRALSEFLRRLLGSSSSPGDDSAGAELQLGNVRRGRDAGTDVRPQRIAIRFTGVEKPGVTTGIGGAYYPEWDVHHNRYRDQWCRVIDYPSTTEHTTPNRTVPDGELRRRLSRIGLGPSRVRGRPDGDELDTDALVDLFIDLRSGYSPPEHVYVERCRRSRDLGVLILLDVSGSATDTDGGGCAVHEHQRRAAATLTATLEELGDRVAVYGFRSSGRHAVHLPAIKTFDQRFGAAAKARLDQLDASGYTRLGAGIRGAGQILKTQAGTPNRLLLVLSDGFPYDDGYEGRYAEADSAKALEELRSDGVACLCLSIGAHADSDVLDRVFGSASHAGAATLAELSAVMDQLFLSALRELAAPAVKRMRAGRIT